MSSRGSHVAPTSFWREAQDRISEAEIMAQAYGVHPIPLDDNPWFYKLVVAGKVGSFRYTAHYREGWPGNGRKPKRMDQHDAIGLLCERAQVAAIRVAAADYVPLKAEPLTPELERLYAVVVNEQPLPGGRSF
jgi:hypothetical protein